ncbi:hypothetical protein [Actinomycetospora cinnamomea]|uniref:Uncharacterized protein n=1 Tax=Actinomycetospora cinnamomea TaxID=663609 RepID=A0A2U1EZP1_9PSEU|nr:hypothetical protein [Actinomycetospora cinnamomea]PVZ05404.1 hypothetical protein C8D89_115109 [Actinomycetospora cinnamomea]
MSTTPSTTTTTPGTTSSTTAGRWQVDVPLLGPVGWPPTGTLAFVVVLGGLVVAEVVSWPVALAVGVGHVLARDHDHRLVHNVGEGLEMV